MHHPPGSSPDRYCESRRIPDSASLVNHNQTLDCPWHSHRVLPISWDFPILCAWAAREARGLHVCVWDTCLPCCISYGHDDTLRCLLLLRLSSLANNSLVLTGGRLTPPLSSPRIPIIHLYFLSVIYFLFEVHFFFIHSI